MQTLEVLVLTPPGNISPSLAIGAARAGARGFFDAEFSPGPEEALAAIQRMEHYAQGPYGVKVGAGNGTLVEHLLSSPPEGLAWVLLAGGGNPHTALWAASFRRLGREIFVECVSLEEIRHAEELGAAGIVLKGNEAGGRVGHETAFILLQRCMHYFEQRPELRRPAIFVQGGIGLHTASACAAAGANGVVLDSQTLQLRESPLAEGDRRVLAALDGSETIVLGERLGQAYRVLSRPRCPIFEQLQSVEERLLSEELNLQERRLRWSAAVREAALSRPGGSPVLMGQDVALGKNLAERFVTIGGVIEAVGKQARHNLDVARRLQPLAEQAPLAQSHRTRYPLLQGPMTRVSDTAAFADAVATAGALPFLALAMLRKAEVEKLLHETQERLHGRSWGVGILGFLPPEIRKEQLAVVHAVKPPFALIAGGRPDQAQELEDAGIPTYLHVPSPGLLTMFMKDGARRFVFEGRECGGHVGPRSSFFLWETMCGILLDHIGNGRGDDLQIVFAGGIHDALSASMVATLAAPLAEKGVKVGALMGTAYLFTPEAVAAGAIVPRFQQEALKCEQTVLLETSPGHAVRCVPTPYYDVFETEKRRLRAEGKSHEEIVKALEWMNIGRLRVASKGVDRVKADGAPRLAEVPEDEQFHRGMYMIGQIAAMRDRLVTMAELHEDVCVEGTRRLERLPYEVLDNASGEQPCDIAIIGMACFYPGASSVGAYWRNILRKHYAVTEVPATHWDWSLFYSTDPKPQDKFISKWGGFLEQIPFDPFRYGITPKTMEVIEPLQLYLLEAVRMAVEDAGYAQRPFNRDKTAAILGIGGGGSPLAVSYGFRTCLPLLDQIPNLPMTSTELLEHARPLLPRWTEDSFPGMLMNVAAGRVANRFNLGGPNYAMDAACASSLAAVYNCIRELETGASDVAIAMGADTVQTPYSFMAFSKTHALSKEGRCRPFDAQADGIVLSEGISAVILKRLADAERDGDRIYAVIRGIGCSSDGKEKGLTAPNAKGQLLALRRAYAKAGVSPTRLELIEAHGTGTVAGDKTEAEALSGILIESGALPDSCALGSVKSMIGHSKCAAGLAGLIKTTLALHKKTLPPTIVERPNSLVAFDNSPLYLNTEARPWVHGGDEPRLAGVSAFGFGGTNYHVVLEEYTNDYLHEDAPALDEWPAELCVWRRATRGELADALRRCHQALADGARPELRNLAASLWKENARRTEALARQLRAGAAGSNELSAVTAGETLPTLAIVATSLDDLREKLAIAIKCVDTPQTDLHDPRGIYFAENPASRGGKLAFLFPGQGSQYPNMLAQQAMNFAEVRQCLDRAAGWLADCLEKPLGRFIYPPSAFDEEHEQRNAAELARTDVAQAALGAVGLGMFRLLGNLGLSPDFLAGHSYGEYAALAAAGSLREEDCIRLSYLRGKLIREGGGPTGALGGMIALEADAKTAETLFAGIEGVTLANLNSPKQTVIAVADDVLEQALARCQERSIRARRIPVSCAFHSPLVAQANAPLAAALAETPFAPPQAPVFANATAEAYPHMPQEIASLLARHLISPVRFNDEIEAMYAAGARVFVEVGPQGVLTNLVGQILSGRPHLAAASDIKGRDGLVQLCHVLGQLLVHGAPANLERLFAGRDVAPFELSTLPKLTGQPELPRSAWVVNSVRAKPLHAPEPLLLGQKIPADRVSEFPPKRRETSSAPAGQAANASPVTPSAPAAKGRSGEAGAIASEKKSHAPAPAIRPAAPASSLQPSLETKTAMHHAPTNGASANGVPKHEPTPPAITPPQVTSVVCDDDVAQVMLGYQNLMARFLDTQRSVMLAYLQGDPGPAPVPSLPPATLRTNTNGATLHGVLTNGAGAPGGTTPAVHYQNGHSAQTAHASEPAAPTVKSLENGHSLNPGPIAPTNRLNREAAPPAPQPEARIASADAPTAPVAGKPTAANAKATFSREEISNQLLDLVSERTGYPHDMLDVDLDLEADLGIDSIKRVEILGNLAESLGMTQDGGGSAKVEFERLTSVRTIRGIVDYLEETLAESQGPAGANASPPSETTREADQGRTAVRSEEETSPLEKKKLERSLDIQRGLLELIDAPLPTGRSALVPSGVVLITDDGRGVGAEIAERFADFGQECVFIRPRRNNSECDGNGVFYADLTDEADVIDLARRIRKAVGEIGGLLHLLPLAPAAVGETSSKPATQRSEPGTNIAIRSLDADRETLARMTLEVKGLYLLARELEDDLRQAGRDGGAVLLAATALGGGLGMCDAPASDVFFPGHGGVAGFVKCLGQEWPEVLVRVVDLDGQQPIKELAECLLAELNDRQGPREVGYLEGRRVTWRAVEGELSPDREPASMLNASSTLLVTGGARGITAAIAEELARRFQCNLVLVGRSAAPEGDESPETASLESPADIKAALIARLKQADQPVTPVAVQLEFARLMRDREIRDALNRIRAAGSQVIYRAADVRDEAAMAAVIAEADSQFGGVDGVIHGAGVIEDKLVRDKTPASFDRVFGTKIESALILSRLLDFRRLKFCVLFASVASRYGNRGQSDYAAANEVLTKLAWRMDRETPCRVLAIDWGPWSGIGMVSDLEKHLVARGLKLISPEVGVQFFAEELLYGRKGESEVIIGGAAEKLAAAPQNDAVMA